jgi:hypothetical protein
VEVVAHVAAFVAGGVVAVSVLFSAIKTVVVPRAEAAVITRAVFLASRRLFDIRVRMTKTWEEADRIMARYAPFSLILLPGVWVVLVMAAFVPMYWAVGVQFPREAVTISGSSLLTLGFAFHRDLPAIGLEFVEATLGLGLVALLISYLPTIYGQFSRREVLVGQLDTRAGTPPSPVELLRRAQRIGWLATLDDLWEQWDRWFVEVEESHTSNGSLSFFRSQHPERSWITAAGCVLDTAALRASTVDLPRTYRAELCIRSGYLALRRVADFFDIAYDDDPAPDAPISITREEWDEVYEALAVEGLPLKADREQAWRDFAGWRVNYDAPLIALAALVAAPYAPWSSDRAPTRHRLQVFRRRRGRSA